MSHQPQTIINPYKVFLKELYAYCKATDRPVPDPRFRCWFKMVKGWGDGRNGWTVDGDFVADSSQEINPSEFPALILASWSHGSRKYSTTEYELFLSHWDEEQSTLTLEPVGAYTDSTEAGWALRLRDTARLTLKELAEARGEHDGDGDSNKDKMDTVIMIRQILADMKSDYHNDPRIDQVSKLIDVLVQS